MVLKTTTWTPDTCGCTLSYEWDDDGNDNVDKVHTFKQVDRVGVEHIDVDTQLGHEELFNKVKEENNRKNKIYKVFIEEVDDIAGLITQKDGSQIRQLLPNIDFEYTFTGSALDTGGRTIEIGFNDTTGKRPIIIKPADITKVETRMDVEGVNRNKVIIK
jgi:hypothetical protein